MNYDYEIIHILIQPTVHKVCQENNFLFALCQQNHTQELRFVAVVGLAIGELAVVSGAFGLTLQCMHNEHHIVIDLDIVIQHLRFALRLTMRYKCDLID
jgi:hypothetical protein